MTLEIYFKWILIGCIYYFEVLALIVATLPPKSKCWFNSSAFFWSASFFNSIKANPLGCPPVFLGKETEAGDIPFDIKAYWFSKLKIVINKNKN